MHMLVRSGYNGIVKNLGVMPSAENPLRRQLSDARIARLLKVVNLLREYDREFPAQALATLLYIGSHDDCHKKAIEEDLDFSTAAGSRNTDWLSQYHRLRKPGMGLIVKEADPTNQRMQMCRLTVNGKNLMNEITRILYEDPDPEA